MVRVRVRVRPASPGLAHLHNAHTALSRHPCHPVRIRVRVGVRVRAKARARARVRVSVRVRGRVRVRV